MGMTVEHSRKHMSSLAELGSPLVPIEYSAGIYKFRQDNTVARSIREDDAKTVADQHRQVNLAGMLVSKTSWTFPLCIERFNWASWATTLRGTDEAQLTLTLCDGQTLGMALSIVRNHKPALTAVALLVDPGGQPKDTNGAGLWIVQLFVSAYAGNARCVVPTKASADPNGMSVG